MEVLGQEEVISDRAGCGHLVAILKLKKDARDHILDVFHWICETSPPPPHNGYESLEMGCPYYYEGHSVSLEAFMLLEKVEAAFGTTLLSVEDLHLAPDLLCGGPTLTILGSRFARQQKMLSSSNIGCITLETKMDEENLLVLLQASPLTTIWHLDIGDPSLGGDDWRLLAEGLHNTHSKYNFEFSVCLEAGPKKRKQGRPEGPLERLGTQWTSL